MSLRKLKLPFGEEKFISIISASEAGIATTAAIISGLIIGTDDRSLVLFSSAVSIFIQAFNSSLISVFKIHAEDEIQRNKFKDNLFIPFADGGLQFLTHLASSLLVLSPVIYISNLTHALAYSIVISLSLLLWIGLYIGKVVHHAPLSNGLQSLGLGALMIIGGIFAGIII